MSRVSQRKIVLALSGRSLGLALFFLFTFATALWADSKDTVGDFYRGRTLRFITAYSPGGSFDNYTRLLGRHSVKYIPGHPTPVVENRTGAGGLIATNYLYNKAPRDGSVILNLDGALVRLQALNHPAVQFDASKFMWLPSPGTDLQICWVTRQSGWSSLAEAMNSQKPIKLGGLSPGTFPSDNVRILQAALGLNVHLVEGYQGGAKIRLAALSGEVDGACMSWEGTKRALSAQLASGEIKVIAQVSEKPWPGLENVPNAMDMAKTEKAKKLLRIGIIGPNDINRVFTMPPAVPQDRVDAVRQAFDETYNDPDFKEEVSRSKLVFAPKSVRRIEEVVALWLGMSEAERTELQNILKIRVGS